MYSSVSGNGVDTHVKPTLPITPSYLKYPVFPYASNSDTRPSGEHSRPVEVNGPTQSFPAALDPHGEFLPVYLLFVYALFLLILSCFLKVSLS